MLISLLVSVVIAGLIYYCLTLLPLPPPFKQIVVVILILACVVWLCNLAGWLPAGMWRPVR